MYFVNSEHERNFNNLATRVRKMKFNKEYKSVGYILTLPELNQKSAKYFSDDGFKAASLFKNADLSSGYRMLVKLAWDLFNGKGFSIGQAIDVFDDKLYRVMIQAIEIRRG